MPTTSSPTASQAGLTVWFELKPGVEVDRVPMRTLVLHFKNDTAKPMRVLMPPEAFRANISTFTFIGSGASFFEPEPRPHGHLLDERDFTVIEANAEATLTQRFTIDPFGPGTTTVRRKGFEDGAEVSVVWTYENQQTEFKGGAQTLDGPTKPLFGGAPVAGLWVGSLTVRAKWRVGS